MNRKHGFTIIELLVTIVILGVLVSISIFGYNKIQANSRDSQRSARIGAINEALEKYYAKNGEYPSCAAMTQDGATVTTNVLVGLAKDALLVPYPGSATNSIICTSLTSASNDAYAYIGDGSATCSTGTSCLQYTLQYKEEETGAIKSITSRHQAQLATSGTATVTATSAGDTQINVSWTNVSGAVSYQLQRATDSGFTANLTTTPLTTNTSNATGLTPGTTYYFRVAAVSSTSTGDWSPVASANTSISPPAAPGLSAAMNGTNAEATATAVTCGSGTVQYQFRSYSANNATITWGGWGAWGSTTTLSVAASQGYQYGFQVQARCLGPSVGSSSAGSGNTATTVRPIAQPAAPTWVSPASFKSNVNATVNYSGSCPSGTSIASSTFRSRAWTGSNWGPYNWGFVDSWTNNTGSNKNVEYWGKYLCQTTYATSVLSPESYNVIVVTP